MILPKEDPYLRDEIIDRIAVYLQTHPLAMHSGDDVNQRIQKYRQSVIQSRRLERLVKCLGDATRIDEAMMLVRNLLEEEVIV